MTAKLHALQDLVPNADWASLPLFDRTVWTRLPFGEFAQSVNERVEPANAADEIYVGLDDLDPGCLQIRRWGKGSDVIGTKLRFRKGDIIFGRRRAYQRKLAVAEMEGICSAHAMVVRARREKVLPEFLPFLMMSDRFMNRAVEISVGSLAGQRDVQCGDDAWKMELRPVYQFSASAGRCDGGIVAAGGAFAAESGNCRSARSSGRSDLCSAGRPAFCSGRWAGAGQRKFHDVAAG